MGCPVRQVINIWLITQVLDPSRFLCRRDDFPPDKGMCLSFLAQYFDCVDSYYMIWLYFRAVRQFVNSSTLNLQALA